MCIRDRCGSVFARPGSGTGARVCAGTRVAGRAARGAIDETRRDARPRALTLRLLLPHLALTRASRDVCCDRKVLLQKEINCWGSQAKPDKKNGPVASHAPTCRARGYSSRTHAILTTPPRRTVRGSLSRARTPSRRRSTPFRTPPPPSPSSPSRPAASSPRSPPRTPPRRREACATPS